MSPTISPALDWGTFPLLPDLELRITGTMPPLSPALETLVAAHWTGAAASHALFNGRVFCAETVSPSLITGHWTEYRRVVAQMADPGLFASLQVRSVAVCGILRCPEGIVVGRRHAASVYQPGLWQLAPAGSVDGGAATAAGADWRHALLAELREELGIGPEYTSAITPVALVQHPTGVLDLGFRIETPLDAAGILGRHRDAGDGEYDQLRIHPEATLTAAVEAEGGRLVPAAKLFLGY